MRSFVTAEMIANRLCSPSRDGQELLPHLVDKLITASISKQAIHEQRFPHGDQVYLHGVDGILAVDDTVNHIFVPSGLSLWEMGTSTDPKSKADDDFSTAESKLANAFPTVIPAVTPDKATFVFVTSKPWEAGAWIKDKRAKYAWKSIKVVDAVSLEKWIELCPAVMLWFADVCGLPAEGLYDAEQYLRKLGIGFGVEAIAPDLVVAGRADDLQRVRDLVVQSTAEVRVRGESAEEAAAFLAAASLKDVDAFKAKPPLVFADAKANLTALATFQSEMTLIPLDSEALTRARGAAEKKWRLVLPEVEATNARDPGGNVVSLGRCKRAAVEQYLVEQMKIEEHSARQIVRDTKGSLVALLWLVGSGPVGAPRWACRKDATTHASLMLVGSWLGSNESDTKIVERLSRKDYRDIETLLQSAEIPEGPWIHRGVEWLCASRDFVWGQLVGKVTETMLTDFKTVLCEVVGEEDPSLELPVSERYMAAVLGKTRKHSSILRAGLVDSLARLATFRADGQGWADRIVHDLLDPEHPQATERWLSLRDVYSELAEAAPGVFLDDLDEMIQSGAAKEFFQDAKTKDVMFGPTSAHTYLLWALEKLAWQKEYFVRVLCALARLAGTDPGGSTSNRPKNSLVTILLPWSPQHAGPPQDAIQAVRTLYSVAPAITWDVSVSLLPKPHDATSPTPRPTYRKHPGVHKVTVDEYWDFVKPLIELLVQWAGKDVDRWASLIEAYPHVRKDYPEVGQIITNGLIQVDASTLSQEAKNVVHAALRHLVSRHREFKETDWALPASDLTMLEDLQARFKPAHAILENVHLFSWHPDVSDAPMKEHEPGWDDWLDGKRNKAAETVYGQDGLRGLYGLASKAALPECVGQAVAKLVLRDEETAELLEKGLSVPPGDRSKDALAQLARGYVWAKHRAGGDKWLDEALALQGMVWTSESYANLALAILPSPGLWARVEEWGPDADRLYWTNVELRTTFEDQWQHVLRKWKEVARPWSSLELVADLVDENRIRKTGEKPSSEQVMDILEQALRSNESVEPVRQQGAMLSYYLEHVFCFLDAQNADPDRLAALEWGWFRVLEDTKRGPRVLQSQVTSSPQLFVDLLKAVFRAENDPGTTAVTDVERRMGEQAYHVLRGIHTVPGYHPTESGGAVDFSALRDWVDNARKLAGEADRIRVCDSQIGQILSYAPASPDGSWPCTEVRDLIEYVQSAGLENGLRVGRYNQRGAIFRGKGGAQEWELAKTYRDRADRVRTGWPRTASILEGLAKGYEDEARQWDARAKRDEYE